jgi:hypothetical protein
MPLFVPAQSHKMEEQMRQNSMIVLKPYRWEGMWVFDDEKTGLVREPFVSGVPEILETLLQNQGIALEEAEKGFRLIFSAIPFPGHQLSAKWVGDEAGGTWYEESGSQARGWLCPALFRYFATAPNNLYVRVERLP